MQMVHHRDAGGEATVPKASIEELGLLPREAVEISHTDDGVLVRSADRDRPLFGRFADSGLTELLIAERQAERVAEQRRS